MDKELILKGGLLGAAITTMGLGQLLILTPGKELYGMILFLTGLVAVGAREYAKIIIKK